jgi:hypothetical protein
VEIVVRLVDGPAPAGQVRAFDGSRILLALHELNLRLGRYHVAMERPGRSTRSVEELTEVRLVSLSSPTAAGTVLTFVVGPPDVLDLDLPELRWQEEDLVRILEGVARDERPDGVPELVADAVADLVTVLRVAADQVDLHVDDHRVPRFWTDTTHRETWARSRRRTDESVQTEGMLERVDLHTHEFRLRDQVGTTVDLRRVEDDAVAARLVGQWVRAEGWAVLNESGRLVAVDEAVVTPGPTRP